MNPNEKQLHKPNLIPNNNSICRFRAEIERDRERDRRRDKRQEERQNERKGLTDRPEAHPSSTRCLCSNNLVLRGGDRLLQGRGSSPPGDGPFLSPDFAAALPAAAAAAAAAVAAATAAVAAAAAAAANFVRDE